MRFRTLALALALACGSGAVAEAKKVKVVRPAQQRKHAESHAAKVTPRKAKKIRTRSTAHRRPGS
jgi:hypothetical protein